MRQNRNRAEIDIGRGFAAEVAKRQSATGARNTRSDVGPGELLVIEDIVHLRPEHDLPSRHG